MKEVRLHAGEAIVQELRTQAGTGFDWTYDVDGDVAAVEVSRKQARVPASQVGGPVLELFVIHAMHAGRATVQFRLERHGEGTPEARETVNVLVVE